MKYQWRSTETGWTTYHDNSSNCSLLTTRNNLQDGIPPGTVASRVQFLQNLANPNPSRSHPPPIRIRRGADSRTGFGRRMTTRFGKPALHNTKPDEEPQVETSLHSFLGLNTPRINHEEQHAIADRRTRYARSPGINGQIIPDGMAMRRQFDAVAPWAVLSRTKQTRSMGRQPMDPEVDLLKKTNPSKNQGSFTTESSRFRGDSEDYAKYVALYRRCVKPRLADTMNSEVSSSTTSTTRRQSVRDLFKDYGIERPTGLGSRKTSYAGNNPGAVRSRKHCHVCSKEGGDCSSACPRCHHQFCSQCDALSPMPGSSGRGAVAKIRDCPAKELASKENWSADLRPANKRLVKRLPSSVSLRKELPLLAQQISQPPKKFPYLKPVETSTLQKTASQNPKYDNAFPKGPVLVNVPQGSQVLTRVRDSPFLIADLLATNRSLPSFPVGAPASNGPDGRDAENGLKTLGHQHGVSSSSGGYLCGSPTCRATHHGHRPYRHAVSCIKKKRNHQAHKDTDNGYSADRSQVEDIVRVNASHCSCDGGQCYHPHPSAAVESHFAQCSRSSTVTAKSLSKEEVPEYVECHGYPRTGHSRLGSPVSSGIVGECQHCLHDCHCLACQRASHSVRCCVHADHQVMIHHHLTPRKEMSVSEKDITKSPIDGPAPANKPLNFDYVPATIPSSDQKSLAETARTTVNPSRQERPVKKPSVVTIPSLPRSKRSTLMAGMVAKAPTPPPWVSSPRKKIESGIAPDERRKEMRKIGGEIALRMQPLVDPPKPFKMMHTFPDSVPCDESSPVTSHRRSNETFANLQSHQEPDLNDVRSESYRAPSRCSIVEKHSRAQTSQSPSRMQMSPPGSRRASRRLSALFQLRQKNTVPLLNQKLLDHQRELRRTQKQCDEQMEAVATSLLDDLPWNSERKEPIRNVMPEEPDRVQSADSSRVNTVRKMKWKLRLVDRKPSPACSNDEISREHRLVDDELDGSKISSITSPAKRTELASPDTEDHDCVWKSKLLEQNIQGLGIRGVTVLLHLEGKEDVTFKVADWNGGEQKTKN